MRLEVERLDHVASTADARVLRATGRAWSSVAVALGVPVLVAGSTRVAPEAGARPVLAGSDGPRWIADFHVPEPVARAAQAWAVEAASAAPSAGPGPRAEHGLHQALDALLALDGRAVALVAEADALEALAARTWATHAAGPAGGTGASRPAAPAPRAAPPAEPVDRPAVPVAPTRDPATDPDAVLRRLRAALDAALAEGSRLQGQLDAAVRERDELWAALVRMGREPPAPSEQGRAGHEPGAAPEQGRAGHERGAPPEPNPQEPIPPEPAAHGSSERELPESAPTGLAPPAPAAPAREPPVPDPGPPAVPGGPTDPDAPSERRTDAATTPVGTVPARPHAPATQEPRPPTHRPRRRRAGTVAISVLAATGALLVGDAVATVLWQEPVTAAFSARQQAVLGDDLAGLSATLARLAPSRPRQTPAQRIAGLAATLRRTARPGRAVGRLSIPRLGESWVVVQGTGAGQLRKGPGHYAFSSLPGRPGTTAIAGHRTTYGAPFNRIDELRTGDRLVARMPYGTFTYRVEGHRIVEPSDVTVLRDIGRPRLVLTACHPKYSAAERIVVYPRQQQVVPTTRVT